MKEYTGYRRLTDTFTRWGLYEGDIVSGSQSDIIHDCESWAGEKMSLSDIKEIGIILENAKPTPPPCDFEAENFSGERGEFC